MKTPMKTTLTTWIKVILLGISWIVLGKLSFIVTQNVIPGSCEGDFCQIWDSLFMVAWVAVPLVMLSDD